MLTQGGQIVGRKTLMLIANQLPQVSTPDTRQGASAFAYSLQACLSFLKLLSRTDRLT